jgi:hypothetical protein
MVLMDIISDRKLMIFKNKVQDRILYSIGLSKKNIDGSYINGFISCRFKKDIVLEKDKTLINIKKAWLDFYINKDKKTIPYIFINEFDIIDENIKVNKEVENDPYEEMGDIVEIDGTDLPF